jgi:ABC-type uncharacterized transport system permease subunit
MNSPLISILALLFYLCAAALLGQRLARGEAASGGVKIGILGLGLGAVLLHTAILYSGLQQGGVLNLALTGAFSLVAWVVVLLYLSASLTRPVDNLGIIILPLAAFTLLMAWLWPGRAPSPLSSQAQIIHIIISILAYSLLSLAAVQSLMRLLQERHLRQKQPGGFIRALPPMETMETLMFQMIGLGFLLLTATIVSGVFFSEALFGQPFTFTHHVVLSVIAWAVYGVLLTGRMRFGWRGRTAIRWTLGAFALLVLAYFGSKFVLEIVLGRTA